MPKTPPKSPPVRCPHPGDKRVTRWEGQKVLACAGCFRRIKDADAAPERPPTRTDVPPQARMQNYSTNSPIYHLNSTPVDHRAWRKTAWGRPAE
jgi:hypothetical protein